MHGSVGLTFSLPSCLQLTLDTYQAGHLLLHTKVPALAGQDQIPDLWVLGLCGHLVAILTPSEALQVSYCFAFAF